MHVDDLRDRPDFVQVIDRTRAPPPRLHPAERDDADADEDRDVYRRLEDQNEPRRPHVQAVEAKACRHKAGRRDARAPDAEDAGPNPALRPFKALGFGRASPRNVDAFD